MGHLISATLVLFTSKSVQKMRRTLIRKELKSGRIFNVCQQGLLKTDER